MSERLGFIGVGVMGEPMCRNLAAKSGSPVHAYDIDPAPLKRLARHGVSPAPTIAALAAQADTIFLSLPGRDEVRQAADALLAGDVAGRVIVDLSTTTVALARTLADEFAARGALFADAPVARTRQAAEAGTLSVMVGCEKPTFARIRPLIRHIASEITHVGPAGAGQATKLMNNMVLFQTVVALAEALTVVRRSGFDPKAVFEAMQKGSADSFALRNHAMKSLLPNDFPSRAFAVRYALKDLSYALELAGDAGAELAGANVARALLEEAIAAGHGDEYYPALIKAIDPDL